MHADPLPPFFFAYSSWTTAQHHMAEAALLGSILGASFLLTAFLTAMGLTFGGRWREMPAGLSWAVVQKLEMVSDMARLQKPCSVDYWAHILYGKGGAASYVYIGHVFFSFPLSSIGPVRFPPTPTPLHRPSLVPTGQQ